MPTEPDQSFAQGFLYLVQNDDASPPDDSMDVYLLNFLTSCIEIRIRETHKDGVANKPMGKSGGNHVDMRYGLFKFIHNCLPSY